MMVAWEGQKLEKNPVRPVGRQSTKSRSSLNVRVLCPEDCLNMTDAVPYKMKT